MQSLSWYANRLRSMSAAEIAWRVRSLLRDQLDIARVPLGLIPRLPASLRDVAFDQFQPGFQCSPVSRDTFQSRQPDYQAAWHERLLSYADLVNDNRLSYFNLDALDHGDPFQWHRDHSAGIDAPIRLSVLTDYRDFKTYGDCKLVWEPNRHHQLVVLARAWVISGDRKYARKVVELMLSWIDANPFGYGMNWKSPLEHGVRIINWVWALDLIRNSQALSGEEWQRIQWTLYLLMWDAQRRYSQGSSANNHLIGEVAGVFFGACYFKELPQRDTWLKEAREILEREIRLQTYDSGCTREHAFGYQFFVIQFFHHCMVAGERCGVPFSVEFKERLLAMYRFMRQIVVDTGDIPNLNDRDDGYVVDLGETQSAPAALVSAGARLFDDPNLSLSDSETAFWLYGSTEAPPEIDKDTQSIDFADAGYYLLRASDAAVFVDAAPLGYGPIAAHGHADCLSFTMSVSGHPVIVDSGTYDYFSDPEMRDYFRTTAAHNTAEVDGTNQSELLGPFMWGKRAEPVVRSRHNDEFRQILEAEHDGYTGLEDPVIHRRRFVLDESTRSLTISDTFECDGKHSVALHLHLAPGFSATSNSSKTLVANNTHLSLRIDSDTHAFSVLDAGTKDPRTWVSPSYHVKQPSTCVSQVFDIDGDTTVTTRIAW